MAKAKRAIIKIIPDETIIKKIYLLRGQKVLLHKDLAGLYEVETKILNQAVKRNFDRFPSDFFVSTQQGRIREEESMQNLTTLLLPNKVRPCSAALPIFPKLLK